MRAADWLLAEEVTVKGDWAVRTPDLAPGGWAFEFENDLYPDVDDTAVVALALRRCHRGHDAVDRGLAWTAGMQSRSGGWGAFDVDNEAYWLYKLPFCDFGKVTDEPSADVTAHALEALAPEAGYDDEVAPRARLAAARAGGGRLVVRPLGRQPRLRHGRRAARPRGLRNRARPSGVQAGSGLARLGAERGRRLRRGHPLLRRAGLARPRGQHAFPNGLGAISLRRCRRGRQPAARRAAEWLCSTQQANGDWDEKHYTGTGFPLDFMIRYHLYRLHFPLLALGRLRERLAR